MRCLTDAMIRTSERRYHLGGEPAIVAAVEAATADKMNELRHVRFHLVAVGIFGMRQDNSVRYVRDDDIRHHLLATPFCPLVADRGPHLRRNCLDEFTFEGLPRKARK